MSQRGRGALRLIRASVESNGVTGHRGAADSEQAAAIGELGVAGGWRTRPRSPGPPGRGTVRTVRRQRNVCGTQAEAVRVRDELKAELAAEARTDADLRDVTFAKFGKTWVKNRKASGEVGTLKLDVDACALRRIGPYLGDVRVREITPMLVEDALARLMADKVEERGSYSTNTVRLTYRIVRQVLDKAVAYGIIARNPCDGVTPPKDAESSRRALSAGEARDLVARICDAEEECYAKLDEAKSDADETRASCPTMSEIAKLTAARIALMTGMRRGEVLALTWEEVDFDNACVRVSKSYNRKRELKATKTKAGVRTIHVDDETMGCLRRWKACQARTLATLRKTQSNDTPVIRNAVGGRLRPDGLWRWWRRFADGNGF